MSNISLNVEFMAGTSIEEAIKEASLLAIRLHIAFVIFSFNGVRCSISRKPNIDKLVKDFHLAIRTDSDFKFICG